MKSFGNQWKFANILLLFLCIYATTPNILGHGIPSVELLMPPSHIALSGDLTIQITSSSFPPLLLQLSRLEGNKAQPLTTFAVLPEAKALSLNSTVVKIACGYFSRGGQYYVLLKKQPTDLNGNSSKDDEDTSVITRSLDVRWPMPQLSITPEHVDTYPEDPVTAILEFPEVVCPPVVDSLITALPEFWIELHYCGHSILSCDNAIGNKSQVLYSEQVRGFPGRRMFTLRCELFGLAGHYAVFLRPTGPSTILPHTAAYLKAEWSKQFVFNVHARSIFPCDVHSGGITVLFQYPSCILSNGDRVRLFARLRANVASLAPPTSLEYVAEQRVTRGQHSLHFDCDLFTEHYVEYCFVYVSQAITGAVADVRMDCVPTLPVSESESGGWGAWSPWTPCSSTCIGGTRSRYRFCDSPPPRYGAKFCEGLPVETEKCGTGIGKSWECFYGNAISVGDIAAEIPEVQAEVGPYCRCGCVVHLGQAKPKRLLATSSQSCPGRTFWHIQADKDNIIEFKVEQFHLPCGTQWLKVRDGSYLSSNLLADLSGAPDTTPAAVNSTGSNLLLEFIPDEVIGGGETCGGGFLAYARQIRAEASNITVIPVAQSVGLIPAAVLKLTAVHIVAIFFISGLLIATALLGAQYAFRYRKYHIAQAEDQDSFADPSASCGSFNMQTRVSSNATLLSEVISLTKLRPHIITRNKHSRLRESLDCEQTATLEEERKVSLAKEEDTLSLTSTTTLTQEVETMAQNEEKPDENCSTPTPESPEQHGFKKKKLEHQISEDKDKCSDKDSDIQSPTPTPQLLRRLSNVSTATLANGCYSSAQSMISTATIRSTNAKETKNKKNREKLLAGPGGSDFSIGGQEMDLEMDYYDYNVTNAGAAPGSYLGMDPAFLVWIPPLDESGQILSDSEREEHEMEDIRPKMYIDPGSNKESPEEEEVLLPKPSKKLPECTSSCSPLPRVRNKRVHPLNEPDSRFKNSISEKEPLVKETTKVIIEGSSETLRRKKLNNLGKMTKTKSPIIDSNILDEIRFADDEDEDEKDLKEIECNMDLAYQHSKETKVLSYK